VKLVVDSIPSSTSVLIAGGGPVGLATAVELAHHGVESIVIERRREVSWLRPRAKTTSARTMEHFRRWGIAGTLRARAPIPVAWSDRAIFCTSLLGREITRIDHCFGLELAGSDLVSEPGQQVAQPLVEQVLRDSILTSPHANLCCGADVLAVGQDGSKAWADVLLEGVVQRVRADYIVGCEGARSVVREAIGSRYQGTDDRRPNFNLVFRSPGLADQVPHGPAVHYWIINPDQPGLIGRLDLDQTWWCIAQGVDGSAGDVDPGQIIANLVGTKVPAQVLASDAWQARMLLVDRYSDGRLFVAGDAAHQNPPWGGHGFNTGIGDAVNLAWKLAAVIGGWAPTRLLDSYEAERRPVAQRTIDEAVRNMSTLAPELADRRLAGTDEEFKRVRPSIAHAIQRTKDSEFHSLGLTLGYGYWNSPIVAGGDTPSLVPDSSYTPSAVPGARLPHWWLGPNDSIYDRLGREFSLVGNLSECSDSGLCATAKKLGVPLQRVAVNRDECQRRFRAALVLVRPDQHVAWRGDRTTDPAGIIRQALGYN
jgi:2-polyprenyl-6-methoxyphenol hydroxylase-like FAD-dependent oxidoreductase